MLDVMPLKPPPEEEPDTRAVARSAVSATCVSVDSTCAEPLLRLLTSAVKRTVRSPSMFSVPMTYVSFLLCCFCFCSQFKQCLPRSEVGVFNPIEQFLLRRNEKLLTQHQQELLAWIFS